MMTTVRREHILLAPKNWVTVCELKKSKIKKKKRVSLYYLQKKSRDNAQGFSCLSSYKLDGQHAVLLASNVAQRSRLI